MDGNLSFITDAMGNRTAYAYSIRGEEKQSVTIGGNRSTIWLKEKEMRKKIFILSIIIVGCAIMTAFFYKRNKYKDLCAYTERLLKIEWNDCIESATGNVEIIYKEEVAHVKLEVRTGYEEEALSILKNKFGKSLERYIIPPWGGHEFIEEVKNGNIQYVDKIVMDGKRIKTRNIEIYAIYNEKEKMYIYIMG